MCKTGYGYVMTHARPKPRKTQSAAAAVMVFGILALACVLASGVWLNRTVQQRSEGLYLQQHGLLAVAQIDKIEDRRGCKSCTVTTAYYHFRDLSGTRIDASYADFPEAEQTTDIKLYYLPEDPSRQIPVAAIPSFPEVWLPPLGFLVAAAFFAVMGRNAYRREFARRRH
jgi:hypothetical protein